jgi:hypothetical protein
MIYIDFKPVLKTGSRTAVRRRHALARRTGKSRNVTVGALDAFMATIDCRYQQPAIMPLDMGPEAVPSTRGPANQQMPGRYLVQVGFALVLPENCHLRWARFVVNQREPAELIVDPVHFVSLLPAVVDREIDMSGPIECDDDGNLQRGVAAAGATGPQGSHFEPWTVGYLADSQTACWDFYPAREIPPAGTQHLILSAKSRHADPAAALRQCLYLHLESQRIGSMSFECGADVSL